MAGNQLMRTPRWLFDLLEEKCGVFTMDVAATEENALCANYLTEKEDGLKAGWSKNNFCNPPFKDFGKWIEKAFDEWLHNRHKTVLIGPVGCSQSWFHKYGPYCTVLMPDRRINFCLPDGSPTKNADRDTMIYSIGHFPAGFVFWRI